MSFIKVYIHFVWSTKNRIPFLATKELRQKVWKHIKENAKEKGIHIDFVNGYSDHCHCLVSLGQNQESHHSKKSFQEEYEEFILKYDFKKFDDQ
jgi:putative transposase